MTFVINYVILMNKLKITNEINGFLYYNPKRNQDNEKIMKTGLGF